MVRSWSWGQDQVCPDSCLCFSPEPSFVGDPMAMTSLLLPVEMAMWSYTNTSPKLEKLICFNPRRSHIRSLWIHPNSLTWPPFWPSFAWTIHDRIDLSNEEITFPNGKWCGHCCSTSQGPFQRTLLEHIPKGLFNHQQRTHGDKDFRKISLLPNL